MTRGRAPNLALPLTKALAQQRDYRARKAANIARLEGENQVLRDENTQLRQDIATYLEGRPVPDRQQDNIIIKDTSEPPVTEIQHSPSSSSAGYLQLKIRYEQLEAEVERKQQVLLSLREKEKEAFARLESLLHRSFQVVGGGAVPPQDAQSHGHGIQTTMKLETLGPYSNLPSNGRNSIDEQLSAPPIRAASRSGAGYYAPPSVAIPGSQPLQSGTTPLSNRESYSPDSESYRARKRVRSSSTFAPSVGPHNGVTSRPYSQPTLQAHDQHTALPFPSAASSTMLSVLNDRPYVPTTRAHVPPLASPFPNYEGGMPRRDRLEPTHPYLYNADRVPTSHPMPVQASAGPFDDPRSRQLQPLPTPPVTGFFRELPSYSRPSSEPQFPMHESIGTNTTAPEGFGPRPWLADQNRSQLEHISDRPGLEQPRPLNGAAVNDARSSTYSGIRQLSPVSVNAPPSFVTGTCPPSKTCGSGSGCNPPNKESNQPCMSPPKQRPVPAVHVAEMDSRGIPPGPDGEGEELPLLTQSNCCNGLFDCSSLPPNLWMPLHQMSTSYERGNNPTKSLVMTMPTVLPSPADLVSGPTDDDLTGEGCLTLPIPRLQTPVSKGSVERTEIATDLEGGQDEECCFGILRCEEEKPSVETS
ncbi:hypothetical protein QFC22_001917 [Naganishia vaughanmartiniae]|uniref:Uncharacterized protein n=1 Tax=Naganishia vaughanmartiniae TaxID=1424756 RepID=A0ACC2XGH1_9TREE|nr:hypothetical protein QFC22_001917 [Naganishia vaughanmartiniae]